MMAKRWSKSIGLLASIALSFGAQGGESIEKSETLNKIKERRTIYIGYGEDSPPFSYLQGDKVVGYSWELCGRIVEAVKERIGVTDLQSIPAPVTPTSRALMLMTGTIDLDCGAQVNTKVRQQSIAFSLTTFVAATKALVRGDASIGQLADLKGKRIAILGGTTTERVVKTVLSSRGIGATTLAARDPAEAFAMLDSRRVDAVASNDVALAILLAQSSVRESYRLLEEGFASEPYAIALRRGDPEFKRLVDDVLRAVMSSGDLEKTYNKWFVSPLPPNGVDLKLPMSDTLKALLRYPNDRGL